MCPLQLAGNRGTSCHGACVWAHWSHVANWRAREATPHSFHHSVPIAPMFQSMGRLQPKPLDCGECLLLPHYSVLDGLSFSLVPQPLSNPNLQEAQPYHLHARKPYWALSLSRRGACKDQSTWSSRRARDDEQSFHTSDEETSYTRPHVRRQSHCH